jgi:hypothetical protein
MSKNEKNLTAYQVCNELNVSVKTLTNWYKWYNDPSFEKPKNMPTLPKYEQSHEKGPRYWSKDDIKTLKVFKESLPRGRNGIMGEFNKRYWSTKEKENNNEG